MRNPARIVALFALFAVGASAQAHKHASRPPARPNVVLISIDTVRADHLGVYGAKPSPTPNLDAFATDAVIFDSAVAQVPLTLASHAAILSGTYPFSNGVQDFTAAASPSLGTVAQAFQRAHYGTCGVVSSFVLDRSWGLAKGFDTYEDRFDAKEFTAKNIALVERPAAQSVDRAIQCIEQRKRTPFFLWLHLYDPHSPYQPPEPFRTRFAQDLYSGEIAYADHEIGRFFRYLKSHDLYQSSAIAVLSDHGESLGEHGEQEHGFFVYRSTIHVPLMIKLPGKERPAPEHVVRPVQTMDVAPTLLAIAKIHDSLQQQFQGRDLFASAESAFAYAETMYPFSSFGWSPLRSVTSDSYHYIEAPNPELYDLSKDPQERRNLLVDENGGAVASVLRQKLEAVQKAYPKLEAPSTGAHIAAGAEEKLRALGYFSVRAADPKAPPVAQLADPKEKIEELNEIMRASDAIQTKRFAAGQAMLEQVMRSDPQLYLPPFLLGEAALEQKDWLTARRQLEKCLQLNPRFDPAMTALARALAEAGDTEAAADWLRKAIQMNSANYRAWYQLARLQMFSQPETAIAAFEKTLTIQPGFALAHRDLGLLQMRRKDYAAAVQHLGEAEKAGVGSPELYNSLGIAYSQTKKPLAAIRSFERALALDPHLAEAHLNLAFELQKTGQLSRARLEYTEACKLESRLCRFVPD